jgi:hypothetical protein
MSVDREQEVSRRAGRDGQVTPRACGVAVVKLACTACQLVWEPDLADFGTGRTGCPRCHGWTWIAHLDNPPADVGGVR